MLRQLFILVIGAAAASAEAHATAFATVEKSFWQADFAYYDDPLTQTRLFSLPAGVTLQCTGTASSDGAGGCMDHHGASVTSNTGMFVASTINALGGLALINAANADYNGTFVFHTAFSAFNPGGPEIGAGVDDPVREYASFFTVVSGPGVFDLHGCDMQHGASMKGGFAPHTCGVTSPDVSFGEALLGPLASGGTLNAEYQIFIRVAAQGADPVPEMPAIFLLSTGLALLGLGRHVSRRP